MAEKIGFEALKFDNVKFENCEIRGDIESFYSLQRFMEERLMEVGSKVVVATFDRTLTTQELLAEMAKHNLRPMTLDATRAFLATYEKEEQDTRHLSDRFLFLAPKD